MTQVGVRELSLAHHQIADFAWRNRHENGRVYDVCEALGGVLMLRMVEEKREARIHVCLTENWLEAQLHDFSIGSSDDYFHEIPFLNRTSQRLALVKEGGKRGAEKCVAVIPFFARMTAQNDMRLRSSVGRAARS